MLLRKINAGLSLFVTFLLLDHAIFLAAWMLSRGSFQMGANPIPWILLWSMVIHAIISILLGILGHKGAEKRKCKAYPKLNKATILQRISGILLRYLPPVLPQRALITSICPSIIPIPSLL